MRKDICVPEELLKECHLKLTEQRIEILEIIISYSSPFTIQEIKNKSKKNIDLATIYRFIDILIENKLITDVHNTEGTQYYELSCVHNPIHPHFICEKCKNIYCLKPIDYQNIPFITDSCPNDYLINKVSINISGICNHCNFT